MILILFLQGSNASKYLAGVDGMTRDDLYDKQIQAKYILFSFFDPNIKMFLMFFST